MRSFSLGLVVLTIFSPFGCATVSRGAADVLLPVAEENKLGVTMQKELAKELTISADPTLNAYVRGLGNKAARAASRDVPAGIKIKFMVVDDDKVVNAFAIPGGTIYVYTGLLKKADNAAEVIAVLSHEVSHVTRRHVAQRLVAAYGLQAVVQVALGEDPGLLGQLVSAVAGGGALLKYGRDQEREADEFGIYYCNRAKYDPMGFVTFFSKLGDGPEWTAIFGSHPAPQERVRTAKEKVESMKSRSRELGVAEHQPIKASL